MVALFASRLRTLGLVVAMGAGVFALAPLGLGGKVSAAEGHGLQFEKCGRGERINCVVDGDTFWYQGEKVRIVDINTPEVSQPECARETELGERATQRLIALLNDGPFELRTKGRNKDQYGRLLRTVHRGDESLGDVLVEEGLAEVWKGRRSSWCGEGAVALARTGAAGGGR